MSMKYLFCYSNINTKDLYKSFKRSNKCTNIKTLILLNLHTMRKNNQISNSLAQALFKVYEDSVKVLDTKHTQLWSISTKIGQNVKLPTKT